MGTSAAPGQDALPCVLRPADMMVGMGYTREEIKEALTGQKYNEVTATYLLLGRKNEVRLWRRGAPGPALCRGRGDGLAALGPAAGEGRRPQEEGGLTHSASPLSGPLASQQVEGGESRTGSSLSLARVRAPSEASNGTGKSSSGHAKSQRSSSTYHRQRRHSDFCEWLCPTVGLPVWGTAF